MNLLIRVNICIIILAEYDEKKVNLELGLLFTLSSPNIEFMLKIIIMPN